MPANSGTKYTHHSNLQLGNSSGGGSMITAVNTDVVAATTAYTVLAVNSGIVHIMPDVNANCTYTLPAAVYGMYYEFRYCAAAVDAHDHIFVAQAGDYMIGGLGTMDTGAGTSTDAYANGSSHITCTVDIPQAGTVIHFLTDGTLWYVGGVVVSDTPAAFS